MPEQRSPAPEERPRDAQPTPEAAHLPQADEALRFHDAVVEWLDLTREFKEETGRGWGLERQKSAQEKPAKTLKDHRRAIAEGRVDELLLSFTQQTEAAKSDVALARVSALETRLHQLDKKIAEFKKRPELRPEVRLRFKEELRFQQVGKELDSLEVFEDQLDRREFELLKTRKGKLGSVDRKMLTDSAALHEAIANRRSALEIDPQTAPAVRRHELDRYRDGLSKDRFAKTPSRKKYFELIRRLWEEGKNVFLTGPTGTGKTELFVHLAKKLYGEPPEIIRGSERTGAPEIFGKTMLKASGGITPEKIAQLSSEVEVAFKDWKKQNPLATTEEEDRAHDRLLQLTAASIGVATETFFQPGRYTAAIDKGRPLIFDEFNLLEPKTRLQLKELYNRKPGDSVTVQEDTGKPHKIQEGFGFGATANIKSEKHKERFELDPAESRVFEMRRVDYLPKEELYDLMLAKLSDKRGGVRLNIRDAHLTLQHLAEAAEMI